jgi:hypothetical protein
MEGKDGWDPVASGSKEPRSDDPDRIDYGEDWTGDAGTLRHLFGLRFFTLFVQKE